MRVTNLTIQLVEDVIRTAFILNAELNWRPTYLFVFGHHTRTLYRCSTVFAFVPMSHCASKKEI